MSTPLFNSTSGCESFGGSREETALPAVLEAESEHDDAFQAEPGAGMRGAPETEGVNVVGKSGRVDALRPDPVKEEPRAVNALRTRADLLAADEDVETVREAPVARRLHRIKRPGALGEALQRVQIRPELLPHNRPQRALVLRVQVLLV